MPNLDGYEATKKIRELGINTPIIAVSAAVLPEDKENSLNAGMNSHIRKPIDNIQLLHEISKYFELIQEEKIEKPLSLNNINLKFIPIDKLSKELNLDDQAVYSLLQTFVLNNADFKQKIKDLDFDSKEFKSIIHKLKGSSGNLKINEIYDLCVDIENTNYEFRAFPLGLLEEKLKELINEIELKITPLIKKQRLDKESLIRHINDLIYDLEEFKFIKQQRFRILFDSLEDLVSKEILNDLKDSVKNSVNDKTIETLNTLIKYLK